MAKRNMMEVIRYLVVEAKGFDNIKFDFDCHTQRVHLLVCVGTKITKLFFTNPGKN